MMMIYTILQGKQSRYMLGRLPSCIARFVMLLRQNLFLLLLLESTSYNLGSGMYVPPIWVEFSAPKLSKHGYDFNEIPMQYNSVGNLRKLKNSTLLGPNSGYSNCVKDVRMDLCPV